MLLAGCAGTTPPPPIVLSLEIDAEPGEVRTVGLFAFDSELPELRCDRYLDGSFDPFVAFEDDQLAGGTFIAVTELASEVLLFDHITTGSRTIIVEAYDIRGMRLFVGCGGPILIQEDKTAELAIDVQPAPEIAPL